MYTKDNYYRFFETDKSTKFRSEIRRDYARVLHSASFRRLSNKTQLFPGHESDFFRDRLTHSLEVAQIAKTLAFKLNSDYNLTIDPDVCEIAGLIHDLGHPPFGHNGEKALDDCLKSFGGFEGNAQTIRIITRLEKKEGHTIDSDGNDCRVGLNLTAQVIASALKYDRCIPMLRDDKDDLVKGYYHSEKSIVDKVKECIVGPAYKGEFKTVECSVMDIADDIAYSTYDIEDAFKAGFLTPYDIMSSDESIILQIIEKLKRERIETTVSEFRSVVAGLFAEVWQESLNDQKSIQIDDELYDEKTLLNFLTSYKFSKNLASNGYQRTKFTSFLVNKFMNGVKVKADDKNPQLTKVYLDNETELLVGILKHYSYIALINSPRLKIAENRGRDIIIEIFKKLDSSDGYRLLPEDFQDIYSKLKDYDRKRLVCDFISGMTDRYALEFYGRLFSENPQSIYKPLY